MAIKSKMLNHRNCNILTLALFLCIITSMGITWFMYNFNKTPIRNFETESFNFKIKVSANIQGPIEIDDLPGSLNNWTS